MNHRAPPQGHCHERSPLNRTQTGSFDLSETIRRHLTGIRNINPENTTVEAAPVALKMWINPSDS
ncbi:hypothetical protein [Oscillatoria acuminata]|uniref:hypothetical protein n=1 Tax=Oscillatoria acuminata TaxID=118323 RepID=UPI0003180F29|nr:hypothetical protein [Oscillatoria acuminata]